MKTIKRVFALTLLLISFTLTAQESSSILPDSEFIYAFHLGADESMGDVISKTIESKSIYGKGKTIEFQRYTDSEGVTVNVLSNNKKINVTVSENHILINQESKHKRLDVDVEFSIEKKETLKEINDDGELYITEIAAYFSSDNNLKAIITSTYFELSPENKGTVYTVFAGSNEVYNFLKQQSNRIR